ncbi:uncharacterized protein LOC143445236 [Clavelina lepadiformis]|uniref:uncharacterized protein LOC143445236 n=1 Tax=Clavelina lepadiformis TaxID=159417 RepID=UPI004043043D
MDKSASPFFLPTDQNLMKKSVQNNSWHNIVSAMNCSSDNYQHQSVSSNSLKSRFHHSSPYSVTNFHSARQRQVKRRGVSPKIFPRKIHVTEEKVATDIGNLFISNRKHYQPSLKSCSRRRTFSEIENSIQLDSDSDTEDHIEIQVSSEFQIEIDKFKRGFFCSTSNSLSIPSSSTALVLWKPPSGAVDELWRTLHKTTETPSSNNPQNENGVTAHEVASRTINSALETNCWTNKTASNSNILCDDVFFHNNNNTDYVDLMEL